MISVIMPTLNAAAHLPRSLPPLAEGALAGLVKELIISDGGSTDQTRAIADAAGAVWIEGAAGRARQMIAGAAAARAPWLLFLHADTALEPGWIEAVERFVQAPSARDRAAAFRFALDDDAASARRVAFWVGLRCALLKLPYGDQGLLVSRDFYDRLGGFSDLPLMEDVDFVRRIGAKRLVMLPPRATTSAEKYRRDGYWRRSLRNLWLVSRYFAGADPAKLAKLYR